MKKNFILYILLILSLGFIFAIPGIPHQFYGNVEVNGQPSNDIITAKINNQEYSTIISEGIYGVNPNTFFVEDPNGDNSGKEIIFYVGGKEAGRDVFESNKLTKLDFSLTTFCGDNYCLGEETCSSCSNDCGICTENNEITILSPTNKIYNTSKVDLQVYSNQNILIWMYSINSETPEVFNPNITLTLYDGSYELTVIGINQAYQSFSKTVSFSVDIPYEYCGDGTCNSGSGETCSTCAVDCGVCSYVKKSSGSSSSSSYNTEETNVINSEEDSGIDTEFNQLTEPIVTLEETDNGTETTNVDEKNKGFFSSITGAVISFGENLGSTKIIMILLIFACLLIVLFLVAKMVRKKETTVSEY